ncbi:hypothetical protein ACIBG8_46410 [Nonomuraea sp. NPDC050556]|uniref:hypothetical protein n=1 Tax=Nonomuraea sp. NPDC050556 TaxID=3364369 RepID=UPI00379B4772
MRAALALALALVNPGFEAGLTGWGTWTPKGDGTIVISSDAAEGSSAAELRTDSADDRVAVTQKVQLPETGGGLLKLRAMVRSQSLTGGRTSIRVQALDAAGVSLGLQYFAQTTGTTAWHEVAGYVEVPPGTATVSLQPMIDSGVGVFAVDGLSAEWAGQLPEVDGWQPVPVAGTPAMVKEGDALRISGTAGQTGRFRQTFPVKDRHVYAARMRVKLDAVACGSSKIEIAYVPLKAGQPLGRYAYTDVDQQRDFVPVAHNVPVPTGADAMRVEITFTGPGTAWVEPGALTELPVDVPVSDSARQSHPLKNPENMMGGSDWHSVADESDQTKRDKLGTLLNVDISEFVAQAQAASASRTGLDVHPEFETHLRRLAELGEKRRAVLGLVEFARGYDSVPYTHPSWSKNTIPYQAVRAYDVVYDAPDWTPETRALVESWLRRSVVSFVNLADKPTGQHNIEVYGFRYGFAVAAILGNKDLVGHIKPMTERMFSGQQFFADGTWEEATTSYHDQVMTFGGGAYTLLRENLPEAALPLPQIFAKAGFLDETLRFPDGVPVAINDTHFPKADDMTPDDPITNLGNTELYGYGHYALTAGDTTDATQASLTLPPTSEGLPYKAGHGHGSHLGMILWGSGMEVLPDQGYPVSVPNNRYWHMDTPAHNVPWIWSRKAAYSCSDALPTRASVLAYDDGGTSGKAVQLIEASEPGPVEDGAIVKRRLLAVIQSPEGRYVVDVSRLKGGDAHQWFLRASEDEDVDLDTNLSLTAHEGTVKSYYESTGKTDGLAEDRDLMAAPRVGSGADDLSFTWTGKRTGTAVHAHLNGEPSDEVIFSQVPTLRRTQNDASRKNDYPNGHFQRRRLVTPSDTTTYSAVYETTRSKAAPKLTSVSFDQPFDPMTSITRLETAHYRDVIYVSDSTEPRMVDGLEMAGRFVLARIDKATGAVVYGYVNGSCHLYGGAYRIAGEEVTLPVTGSQTTALQVGGTMPAWARGLWAPIHLGDGRGWAMRVTQPGAGTVGVHDWVPFTADASGATQSFHPRGVRVDGPVSITVRKPVAVKLGPATLRAAVEYGAAHGKIAVKAALLAQLTALESVWERPVARRALLTSMVTQVKAMSGTLVEREYAAALVAALMSC